MVPCMKLNTTPVTSSQPPHRISPARARSVRGALRLNHSPATNAISAAGSSQETSVPKLSPNSRPMPGSPPNDAFPPPPKPPPPAGRHRLHRRRCRNRRRCGRDRCSPSASSSRLLSVEPPMYGRASAGQIATSATYQPADTTSATVAGKHVPDAAAEPGRRGDQVDQRERGQHQERLQHLGEEPEADQHARPASAISRWPSRSRAPRSRRPRRAAAPGSRPGC